MKDMAYTKTELKKNNGPDQPVSMGDDTREKYPWGLEIRLENESIKKLGIDISNFTVGQPVRVSCVATVNEIRQNQTTKSTNSTMTLQITKMEIVKSAPKKITQGMKSGDVDQYLFDKNLV